MRLWSAYLLCAAAVVGVSGSPVQHTPTAKDALQAAIYKYNAGSGQDNLYKLLRTYCIAIKLVPHGKEYEIGFTLKETACTRGMEDIMEQCEFMNNGTTLTCNALITIRFHVTKPARTVISCTSN
ncbi:cathelicidin-related peptide Pt_CRAMP2-like [Leucoraja erinacea]|uniref:cathelicidin-related peptide Pt_CRAMP2-like n=1 Tax=Leucoraja erinaceus TaxID=7782 RepID=UPI002457B9D6|nr:cathelicidin-related peptide Pt_CRAMP2-like [Leucoraja erinacea]XP_055486917.1 cathelicidin-related peptide Pt_CRAMP2-like [Leucoraja erinacea]